MRDIDGVGSGPCDKPLTQFQSSLLLRYPRLLARTAFVPTSLVVHRQCRDDRLGGDRNV